MNETKPPGSGGVYTKTWISLKGVTPRSLLVDKEHGRNRDGTQDLAAIIGPKIFDNPKPLKLVKHLVDIGADDSRSIIMDFFAGSGTTAHAVMLKNAADNGQRRCISVQLREATSRLDYPTIVDITKERIRRAGRTIKAEAAMTAPDLDTGFRVLKIDTSNMKDVYYAPDDLKQLDLLGHLDNIREDRTPEDLLFQVLVDWGIDLALPIATESVCGKDVFFVDGNALAACFDSDISEDLVKALAQRNLLRAVFRDDSYGSDSVKINVEQIFKLLSPSTEVRSI